MQPRLTAERARESYWLRYPSTSPGKGAFGERLLRRLSRPPDAPPYIAGTRRATLDNALSFLQKTVPNFLSLIREKDVLDFGCGHGLQAAAMAKAGAGTVTGIDLPRPGLLQKWEGLPEVPNLILTTERPGRKFDVVLSCSSFEHFSDPAAILNMMRDLLKPDGIIIISFAEPWFSPYGAHMSEITKLPWVNVLFPEKTVMKVRSSYTRDGAKRYEDVEGGLNRMTIRKFRHILKESGLRVEGFYLFPVKGVPLIHKIPLMREFLVSAVSCVLRSAEAR